MAASVNPRELESLASRPKRIEQRRSKALWKAMPLTLRLSAPPPRTPQMALISIPISTLQPSTANNWQRYTPGEPWNWPPVAPNDRIQRKNSKSLKHGGTDATEEKPIRRSRCSEQ